MGSPPGKGYASGSGHGGGWRQYGRPAGPGRWSKVGWSGLPDRPVGEGGLEVVDEE